MLATCERCRRPIIRAVHTDGNEICLDARARIFIVADEEGGDFMPLVTKITNIFGKRIMIPHDVVCASLYDVEDI